MSHRKAGCLLLSAAATLLLSASITLSQNTRTLSTQTVDWKSLTPKIEVALREGLNLCNDERRWIDDDDHGSGYSLRREKEVHRMGVKREDRIKPKVVSSQIITGTSPPPYPSNCPKRAASRGHLVQVPADHIAGKVKRRASTAQLAKRP
jgi:hypothetical protein